MLRNLPVAWDETKLLDGYPGKDIIMGRRKGSNWYIAGINAETKEKSKTVNFNFLPADKKFKATLIKDGEHDRALNTSYLIVDQASRLSIKMLRRGGFSACLEPIE